MTMRQEMLHTYPVQTDLQIIKKQQQHQQSLSMSKEAKKEFINNSNYNPEDYNNEEDKMPETGAKNDIELADLRGVDYDDAKWDELLDNMTISDMDTVIALGGYQTAAASSRRKNTDD